MRLLNYNSPVQKPVSNVTNHQYSRVIDNDIVMRWHVWSIYYAFACHRRWSAAVRSAKCDALRSHFMSRSVFYTNNWSKILTLRCALHRIMSLCSHIWFVISMHRNFCELRWIALSARQAESTVCTIGNGYDVYMADDVVNIVVLQSIHSFLWTLSAGAMYTFILRESAALLCSEPI